MIFPRISRFFSLTLSPITWVTSEKSVQQGIGLLLFFILAPILGPKSYGLFAIVMVFVGFCEMTIVGAAVEALVTIVDLDAKHLRTANLCILLCAVIMGFAVFFLADLLAEVFGSPELAMLFRVLAILPAISSLTSAPIAVLSRQMRFRSLALRSIGGIAVGGVIGLAFAFSGAGVWSLVAQILAQRGAELGILWASARTRFGLSWSAQHFTDLRGYASSVFVSRSMAWFGGQIPRIVLGWYLGPGVLGLFVLAARLAESLIQVLIVPRSFVARITLRQFSDDQAGMEKAFRDVVREIAFVSFPICCGAAAIIPTLFAAILDNRWQSGVLAAQLMALSGIPMTFYYCCTSAFLAARRPHLDSRVAVLLTASNALALVFAAPFGLNVACGALLLQLTVFLLFPLHMLLVSCRISAFAIAFAQLPLLAAASCMALSVLLFEPFLNSYFSRFAAMPLLIAIGAAIYTPLVLVVAPNETRRVLHSANSLMQRTLRR